MPKYVLGVLHLKPEALKKYATGIAGFTKPESATFVISGSSKNSFVIDYFNNETGLFETVTVSMDEVESFILI